MPEGACGGRAPAVLRSHLGDIPTCPGPGVLWIPPASFSADPRVAGHGLERFSEIGIPGCIAANRRIISELLLIRERVRMTGPGTDLAARLPERLQLSGRTRPELLPDEHSTIGNHFEVAVSPTDPAGRVDTDLTVSGTLRTESVLVAEHRVSTGARAGQFRAALKIAKEMRKSCPLSVGIQDDRFADGILATSGPEYGGAATEVAVGTGVLSADRVDWSGRPGRRIVGVS
ncbi:hypothetical protein ACFY0P_20790 [Streptomyces sp. NPDC001714]|uniref:hypothetical protein n=1 Tax=Streptomyces sp. NPDC001714 TaxID=3364603 RepID=UPI0036B138C9